MRRSRLLATTFTVLAAVTLPPAAAHAQSNPYDDYARRVLACERTHAETPSAPDAGAVDATSPFNVLGFDVTRKPDVALPSDHADALVS